MLPDGCRLLKSPILQGSLRNSSFELDIALIEGPVTNNDLVTFPWMADEMVVVAPKDHPLTGRPVSYEEL